MSILLFVVGLMLSVFAAMLFLKNSRQRGADVLIVLITIILPFIIGPMSILSGGVMLIAAFGLRNKEY